MRHATIIIREMIGMPLSRTMWQGGASWYNQLIRLKRMLKQIIQTSTNNGNKVEDAYIFVSVHKYLNVLDRLCQIVGHTY